VPKLTDFGIARATCRKDERYGMSGKLPFVSPEQAEMNSNIDFHSDIYSLGVVLLPLLTQGFPRSLDLTMREMVVAIRSNTIDWSLLPPDIDDSLKEILRQMLATVPTERFHTTADLARALEYYIYKDGYGPTIVTLANYMKTLLPGIFAVEPSHDAMVSQTVHEFDPDQPGKVAGQWEKTMKLPPGK